MPAASRALILRPDHRQPERGNRPYNGTNHNMPGANLVVSGETAWHSGDLTPSNHCPLTGGNLSGNFVALGGRVGAASSSNPRLVLLPLLAPIGRRIHPERRERNPPL